MLEAEVWSLPVADLHTHPTNWTGQSDLDVAHPMIPQKDSLLQTIADKLSADARSRAAATLAGCSALIFHSP
jgi:hypothetical protein